MSPAVRQELWSSFLFIYLQVPNALPHNLTEIRPHSLPPNQKDHLPFSLPQKNEKKKKEEEMSKNIATLRLW